MVIYGPDLKYLEQSSKNLNICLSLFIRETFFFFSFFPFRIPLLFQKRQAIVPTLLACFLAAASAPSFQLLEKRETKTDLELKRHFLLSFLTSNGYSPHMRMIGNFLKKLKYFPDATVLRIFTLKKKKPLSKNNLERIAFGFA